MTEYSSILAIILVGLTGMAILTYLMEVFNIALGFTGIILLVVGLLSVAGIILFLVTMGDYGDKYKDKIKMLFNRTYRKDVKRKEEAYAEMRILIATVSDKETKQALITLFYDLIASDRHDEAQMLHANLLAPIESSKQLRAMRTSAELESVHKLKVLIGEQVKKVLSDEYKHLDERVNDEIDMLVNLTK